MGKIKVLFTGGGTGGHVMPIIAIARELRRLHPKDDLRLYYIGPRDESGLFAKEGIKPYAILEGKLRRYFSFQNVIDILFKIPVGYLQSIVLLFWVRPHLVFSKGGSGSLVVCAAAWILMHKLFIHESDSVPGLSNRVAARWAKKVFISFPRTEFFDLRKTILVGNPIKKELLEGNPTGAQELLNVTFEKPIIFFTGGSQGSKKINEFVLSLLYDLLREYEVIHACGKTHFKQLNLESQATLDKNLLKYYHLFDSLDELKLKHTLNVASLVISRAGAGGIFEIAAVGKPSILIPLPTSAYNHQSKNAYQYAKTGASVVIEEENLTHNFFIGKINYLLLQPERIKQMEASALQFAKPLAAKAIAREILEYLGAY